MKFTRWTTIIASALTLAVGACARNATLQPERSSREISGNRSAVVLTVTNNYQDDVRIYAVSEGGMKFRIGTASAFSSATFRVSSSWYPMDVLRLVAVPVIGRGFADSGPLSVNGIHTVDFRIQPHLANSYGMIR